MDELNTLQSLGFGMFSVPYLIGAIIFNIIGYIAYRHGKKMGTSSIRWIGFTLMLYPILVSDVWLLYLIGSGLCVGLLYFYFYYR